MLKFKNNVLKIVIIMLVIIALVVPTTAYASDGSVQIITPGNAATPTPTPTVTPSPVATTTPTVTATPTSQTKLPQTGIEDYTGLIVVTVLLGASAIFAYKKMRELY